jgi:hypothetical protein
MLTQRISTILLSMLGAFVFLSPSYAATILTYDSSTQSVFNTLVQNTATIGFDDQLAGANNYKLKTDVNGFSIGPAGELVQFVGFDHATSYYTNISWYPGTQKDWGTNAVLETNGYNTDANRRLRIVLPNEGATEFSLDLMTWVLVGSIYHSGGSYNITLSNGDVLGPIATAAWYSTASVSPASNNPAIAPTWLGVRSDTAITWIDIRSTEGSMMIDNFTFGSTAPPSQDGQAAECTTMLLIGTGLAGLKMLHKVTGPPRAL